MALANDRASLGSTLRRCEDELTRGGKHRCSECGREHAEGLFEEAAAIRFRDCSIGDFETYLEVEPVRVACCGGTRTERLPFVMPGFRMTRRMFERIAALCTRLPIAVVAQMAKLSWATVAKVDGHAIALGLDDRAMDLTKLRWIGVDEVSWTGGRKYFTIVTDLESGRVVWIGDGKGKRGLLPFLRALGARGRRKLRGMVSDLGYQSIIAKRAARGSCPRSLPHRAVGERGAHGPAAAALLGSTAR